MLRFAPKMTDEEQADCLRRLKACVDGGDWSYARIAGELGCSEACVRMWTSGHHGISLGFQDRVRHFLKMAEKKEKANEA